MERQPRVGLVAARSATARGRRIDDARRDELINEVQRLILTDGFRNLTVDDLASRLQCSKSTIYAIASSKESLVAMVIERFLQDVASRVEQHVADAADPVSRITTLLLSIGRELRAMSRECFEDMGANDSIRETYFAHSRAWRKRVAEIVEDGVRRRRFRRVDPAFMADAVSLLIDGIQWGRLLEDTDLTSDDAYREVTDLVVAALSR